MIEFSNYWKRLEEYGNTCTGYGVEHYRRTQREHYDKYKARWEEIGKPSILLHKTAKQLTDQLRKCIPADGPLSTSDGHCFNTGSMREVDRFADACPLMQYKHDGKTYGRSISEHTCVSKWYALYIVCKFPEPPTTKKTEVTA